MRLIVPAHRRSQHVGGGMILLRGLSGQEECAVRSALTRMERGDDGVPTTFELFRHHRDGILVPRYFGSLGIEVAGEIGDVPLEAGDFCHQLVFPPRDHQLQVTRQLDSIVGDVGIEAPCAFGKTYLAAYAAALRVGRMLVIVPNQNKMGEWRRELARFFGLAQKDIGTIQASKRDWKDKPVTIAMAKTMAIQTFEPELVHGFALTVSDEIHICTAAVISGALGQVAGDRLALTATPGRGLRREVIELHYGSRWLRPRAEIMPCRFEFVRVSIPARFGLMEWERLRTNVFYDRGYTAAIASITRQLLEGGRRVLVVGNQISPLMETYRSLGERGGFVVGAESLKTIAGAFGSVARRIGEQGSWPKRVDAYLSDVKAHDNPILGIGLTKTQPAGTGMDVPDLDGGVITLPVGNPDMVTQLLGRWGRVHPGKKNPLVVVMVPGTAEAMKAAGAMSDHLRRRGVEVFHHDTEIDGRSLR